MRRNLSLNYKQELWSLLKMAGNANAGNFSRMHPLNNKKDKDNVAFPR